MIRHQLPAYSPVSAKAAFLAAGQLSGIGEDPRPALGTLLKREYDAGSVVLCGSGTQALTLAIREARQRVDAKAPVAIPAFSCFDVASAAIGADAPVSLYDLDPDTLSPDLGSLEQALRAGARVVIAAPLYGIPVDWKALTDLTRQYEAVLIEDAAQGHGASWNRKRLGSLGKIAILSFGRGKGWTGGTGGAILLSDSPGDSLTGGFLEPEFSQGVGVAIRVAAQWALARPDIYGLPVSIPALRLGETTYLPPRPVSAMTRVAAATLLATYDASRKEGSVRQSNATAVVAAVEGSAKVKPIPTRVCPTAGYLRLPVRIRGGMASFPNVQRALQLGITPSYSMSLAALPQLAGRLVTTHGVLPGAQTLVRELVTVPTHSRLRAHEVSEIIRILRALKGS
ncbi:MAG: DegT/DnrJ/EryC1/StrS family aminotransferase [Gemmatimonadota bacterium]|nr:DegT/DnrJ/EryC1/StrS family aminotransferase [Gemmatimonadota bacterium]